MSLKTRLIDRIKSEYRNRYGFLDDETRERIETEHNIDLSYIHD